MKRHKQQSKPQAFGSLMKDVLDKEAEISRKTYRLRMSFDLINLADLDGRRAVESQLRNYRKMDYEEA